MRNIIVFFSIMFYSISFLSGQQVIVSGAGHSAFNGIYDYAGQYNAKPFYQFESINFLSRIEWNASSSRWTIQETGGEFFIAIQ